MENPESILNLNREEKLKEIFPQIHNLRIINDTEKSLIILIYEGLKPVSDIWPDKGNLSQDEYELQLTQFQDYLKDLNLYFTVETEHDELTGGDQTVICIARQKEDLEKFISITEENDEDNKKFREKGKEIGRLYGFPETAVEAWERGEEALLPNSELKKIIEQNNLLRSTVPFRFSKDHWKEEFEQVKKYNDKIKEIAPELYEKIVSEVNFTSEELVDIITHRNFIPYKSKLLAYEKWAIKYSEQTDLRNPQNGKTESFDDFFKEVHQFFDAKDED